MNYLKLNGSLHRNGYGEIDILCKVPKDAFPELQQGDDCATEAIIEITLLDKKI